MTKTFALLTALSLGAAVTPSQAEISVEVFYNSLDSHGDWMEAGDYGYVWHPRDVDDDWRPYSDGNWAYTDAGWTWVSNEPHGWATYHYGRWARLENTGWVWVPGTEWGPAWVSWRRSERHVGWAPLPPEAKFSATVSIGNWADSYYDIGPANYTFVEVRNLGAPRLRTVILPVRENVTFIRETRNITNIIYQNNIVINEGPRYDDVVRVSAQPIRRLRLDRQTDFRDVQSLSNYRTRVEGDSLRIAAPAVAYNANVAPRRVSRKVENAQVNRGWRGVGGSQQEVERLRTTVRQEAQAPANLPAQPRFEREERSTTAGNAADTNRTGRPAAGTSTTPGATPAQGTSSTAPDANAKTPGRSATTPDTTPDVPGRPGRAARPDPSSATPDATKPADSTNRPGVKSDADSTKPDATNRPGRGDAENRPGSPATPDSKTPDSKAPESKTPDASTQPDTTKPGRGTRPNADDSKNRPGRESGPDAVDRPERNERGNAKRPDAPGASTTPGSPDPSTTGRPEAPGRSNPANRPESPGRSDRPGRGSDTDATRSDAPSRAESPRNEKPERAERPNRPEPSERPNRPEATERSNRSDSPTRPEASSRPEAPQRESRQEKPAQAERQPKAERPSAEAPRPEPQRPERAERPKAERPAPAEQPKQREAASRPAEQPKQREVAARPSEQPKPAQARGGDDEKERGKKKE